MAGNDFDMVTRFRGTRKQVKSFLDRQPTQIGKTWVVRDSYGRKFYLT